MCGTCRRSCRIEKAVKMFTLYKCLQKQKNRHPVSVSTTRKQGGLYRPVRTHAWVRLKQRLHQLVERRVTERDMLTI